MWNKKLKSIDVISAATDKSVLSNGGGMEGSDGWSDDSKGITDCNIHGATATGAAEGEDCFVRVQFEDGSSQEVSALVGADGIHSTVRAKLHALMMQTMMMTPLRWCIMLMTIWSICLTPNVPALTAMCLTGEESRCCSHTHRTRSSPLVAVVEVVLSLAAAALVEAAEVELVKFPLLCPRPERKFTTSSTAAATTLQHQCPLQPPLLGATSKLIFLLECRLFHQLGATAKETRSYCASYSSIWRPTGGASRKSPRRGARLASGRRVLGGCGRWRRGFLSRFCTSCKWRG